MEDDLDEAQRFDHYQAGFSPERLETDHSAFQELSCAEDIYKLTKLS